MRISDWSSDVCSSDLSGHRIGNYLDGAYHVARAHRRHRRDGGECDRLRCPIELAYAVGCINEKAVRLGDQISPPMDGRFGADMIRSEEHTSELQSLMRISYAVFCLKKKKDKKTQHSYNKKNISKSSIQQ